MGLDHRVDSLPDGFQPDGSVISRDTLRVDDENNLWLVPYNRQCRRCHHVWYVPTGIPIWDKERARGPILVCVPGENRRINAYIREHGGITVPLHGRIIREEREKAGFMYDPKDGRWIRKVREFS